MEIGTKDWGLFRFDENNECVLENFTSKLGEGYLIIHNKNNLSALYGDNLIFNKFT